MYIFVYMYTYIYVYIHTHIVGQPELRQRRHEKESIGHSFDLVVIECQCMHALEIVQPRRQNKKLIMIQRKRVQIRYVLHGLRQVIKPIVVQHKQLQRSARSELRRKLGDAVVPDVQIGQSN